MSNQNIYQKIISSPRKVSFGDIFGGSRTKHPEKDRDYAMIAGTTLDTVQTELGMLQKWQQPWLFMRIMLAGFAISGIMVGAVILMIILEGVSGYAALNLLVIMVPPCIVPVALMIFFWEMNAPRDISLTQMIGYFASGGVLSILFTGILHVWIPLFSTVMAPVTEEPAKLAATLFFLSRIYKKRGKVYGFTGLAIGAAVGAGFAAFESAQYAYQCLPEVELQPGLSIYALFIDGTVLIGMLSNIILRNICALAGHVLYCAPYACFAALAMEKDGNPFSAFSSGRFWLAFVGSSVAHALWNTSNPSIGFIFIKLAILSAFLWCVALSGIRRSFWQLTQRIQVKSAPGPAAVKLMVQGTRGVHAGVAFSLTSNEVVIGTDPSCKLTYPMHLSQINKQHCKLLVQNGVLYLADLGTHTGTYLNGSKLPPLKGYPLKAGDRFSLGGPDQEFMVV